MNHHGRAQRRASQLPEPRMIFATRLRIFQPPVAAPGGPAVTCIEPPMANQIAHKHSAMSMPDPHAHDRSAQLMRPWRICDTMLFVLCRETGPSTGSVTIPTSASKSICSIFGCRKSRNADRTED